MTSVQLRSCAYGSLQVVTLRGDLDQANADDIAATLVILAAGCQCMILDLAALEFIDCYALRALVRARAQGRQQGGEILLAAPPAIVKRLLKLTGLGHVLPVHATVTTAAAASVIGITGRWPADHQKRKRPWTDHQLAERAGTS